MEKSLSLVHIKIEQVQKSLAWNVKKKPCILSFSIAYYLNIWQFNIWSYELKNRGKNKEQIKIICNSPLRYNNCWPIQKFQMFHSCYYSIISVYNPAAKRVVLVHFLTAQWRSLWPWKCSASMPSRTEETGKLLKCC